MKGPQAAISLCADLDASLLPFLGVLNWCSTSLLVFYLWTGNRRPLPKAVTLSPLNIRERKGLMAVRSLLR